MIPRAAVVPLWLSRSASRSRASRRLPATPSAWRRERAARRLRHAPRPGGDPHRRPRPIRALAVSASSGRQLDRPGCLVCREAPQPRSVVSTRTTRSLRGSGTQHRTVHSTSGSSLHCSRQFAWQSIDSGIDGAHPEFGVVSLPRRASSRVRHGRHPGSRDVRRRPDRSPNERRCRDRRPRTACGAPDREGRWAGTIDPRRGGGEGDPLGSRQRCAHHQHEPRRPPRSARSRPGHVLAARGGRGRLRGLEGRARRGRGRELRSIPGPTVALRELARRTATRRGRQRTDRTGGSPAFSNRDTRFNDIAAPGEDILSTFPLPLTSAFPACAEQGYSSCGPEEYRIGRGNEFRRPAGHRRSRCTARILTELTPDQVTSLLLVALSMRLLRTDADRASRGGTVSRARPARSDASLELLSDRAPASTGTSQTTEPGQRLHALRPTPAFRRNARLLERPRRRLSRLRARGERITVTSAPEAPVRPALALWRPGTQAIDAKSAPVGGLRHARRERPRDTGLGGRLVRPARSRDEAVSGAYRLARLEVALGRRVEQFVLGDVAQHAGRRADDDDARWDVLRHDGARTDEGVLADLDLRAEDGTAADRAPRVGSSGP